jgi:selenocysteine-specific elongation factor
MVKRLRATLANSKFHDANIVAVAAQPGGPDAGLPAQGLDDLIAAIGRQTFIPNLAATMDCPALFAVDHCFAIKGQGTVMTGTVLQGTIRVGDPLEIPSVAGTKKVKSIQMFRVGVERIGPGDRAGVCVTQFEPSLLERGLVCAPGAVPVAFCAVMDLQAIPYYKGEVRSKAKFHISLGHETVMARITIFSRPRVEGTSPSPPTHTPQSAGFNFDVEYKYEECHSSSDPANKDLDKFVLLEFERAVAVVPGCIVIGSRLDSDINANLCRLAFHGRAHWQSADKQYAKTELPKLKIYKDKAREGTAERAANEYEVIVRDLFKKETSLDLFVGLRVSLSSGEAGVIEGTFGQSGKVKVRVMEGLQPAAMAALGGKKKKGDAPPAAASSEPVRVVLKFKRYVFDPKKQMIQS